MDARRLRPDLSQRFLTFAATWAITLLAWSAPHAHAQCPAAWLESPHLGSTNNAIYAMVVLPGGDVIVGGGFNYAGGVPAARIARYNPTTRAWSALGAAGGGGGVIGGINTSEVRALLLLPSGEVIVGGRFATVGGAAKVAANNIARYNPATGAWSALGGGVNAPVRSLALAPNGDVLVGGSFTDAGGVACSGLARLAGGVGPWTGFIHLFNVDSYTSVTALAALLNGDLIMYAGGNEGRFYKYIAATQTWTAFYPSYQRTGTVDTPVTLTTLPSGDLIITALGLPTGGHSSRFSVSGNSFGPLGAGVNDLITALAVAADGTFFVSGNFTLAGGLTATHAARFNPSNNLWTPLATGETSTASAIAVTGGTSALCGTNLSNGVWSASGLSLYSDFLGVWTPFDGAGGPISAITRLPDGDLVVGGMFLTAGGVLATNIARYNPATGVWSDLGTGLNGPVDALATLPGGDIVAGGRFTAIGFTTLSRIARCNPSTRSWSPLGAGASGGLGGVSVNALAVLPGGDLIAGGQFTSPGRRIARYNPATDTWSSIGPVGGTGAANISNIVNALAVHPGGDVFVGGNFAAAGGVAAGNFARYSPASNTWSAPGIGTDGDVRALTVAGNGDVIIGGDFQTLGTAAAPFIGRWIPGSLTWSTLGPGVNGTVRSLAALDNGDVIAAGDFLTAGGLSAQHIARYTPSLGAWSTDLWTITSGFTPVVSALLPLPGAGYAAGGNLYQASGPNLARGNNLLLWGQRPVPVITTHPVSVAVCPGGVASFTVAASGVDPKYSWEWRQSVPPGSWNAVVEDYNSSLSTSQRWYIASGAATATLTIIGLTADPAADRLDFRATPIDGCSGTVSLAATRIVCRADFNCVGGLSMQDIFDFLAAYFTGNNAADFNGSGAVSVQDVFDLLAAYFAGCAT